MYTPYILFVAPPYFYNDPSQYTYPTILQNTAFSTLYSSQTEASPIKEEVELPSI